MQEARATAKSEAADDEIPLIVFIGDGVSDLPAAREADVLFARKGLRLEEYCIENKIPYIGFDTFAGIQKEIKSIMKEDEEKTGGVGKPVRFNPRANLWRRVSSQQSVSTPNTFLGSNIGLTELSGSQVRRRYPIKGGEDVPVARGFLGLPSKGAEHRRGRCSLSVTPS